MRLGFRVTSWYLLTNLALLTTLINLYSVRLFAETEYWLAFIKIAVIIILIVFALYLVGREIF